METATHQKILVIDIGNTSVALGVYSNGHVSNKTRHPSICRDVSLAAKTIRSAIKKIEIDAVVLASVVPNATSTWQAAVKKVCGLKPLLVNGKLDYGIKIPSRVRRSMGADRLADCAGAVGRYRLPIIIIDIGTAVTFDVITPHDGYIGGVIAPGWPFMFDYLAERTAQLPRIKPTPTTLKIGRNTVEHMRVGAYWGYIGMVREILSRLIEYTGNPDIHICATGGYARQALKDLDFPLTFDDDLTLYGLGRIYELNTKVRSYDGRKKRSRHTGPSNKNR